MITILVILIRKIIRKKALNKLYLTLTQISSLECVKKVNLKAFDFEMNYNNKIFLV